MDMSAFRYPSARALTVSHELDSVEEHAYDQWDYLPSGMLVMRRPWAFALPVFDTGGEFMLARASIRTNEDFKRVPNVNRAYRRIRHHSS